MIARVRSCCLTGIDGSEVIIEADMALGLPAFDIVGLPDASVKESKERVRTAIKNCNFQLQSRKFTINLAPAGLKKEGAFYDLPIAIAILLAQGQIFAPNINDYMLLGELSLSGEIRAAPGVLPSVMTAKKLGIGNVLVPYENAEEASLVSGINVYGAKNLHQAAMHLVGKTPIPPTITNVEDYFSKNKTYSVDFSEVKGQYHVKRALEIAAAGGHNCLIIGVPGSGKTMLAMRLPTILPDLTIDEALEVTKIHSVSGLLTKENPLVATRPFRNPHHTMSTASLVGGGQNPKPGELSLSHNGIIFLDELPEYKKDAIEVMRQPLEDGAVTISRVQRSISYPCRTMLVAAMNPCKCGYHGDNTDRCRCNSKSVKDYLSRISGPLLDRIDIQVEASTVAYDDLQSSEAENSETIKARVEKARAIQTKRYASEGIYSNAQLSGRQIQQYCFMTEDAENILREAFDNLMLSARAHAKILKLARTIADLGGHDKIEALHVCEAVSYRSLDKKYWN